MRFVLICITFSFLVSCVPPKKPVVEICQLDFVNDVAYCGMTDRPQDIYEVSLEDLDKATAFTPKNWEKIKNYIDEMEVFAKEHCR